MLSRFQYHLIYYISMKTLVATLLLCSFITLGGVGLLSMVEMGEHHHDRDCPFMPGEYVICTMTAFDHITAWRHIFAFTLPALFVCLLLLATALCVWKHFIPPKSPPAHHVSYHNQKRVLTPLLYQELFSCGILNPKNP